LILLVAVILAAEQLLANRFYQDYDTGVQTSRAAELAHESVPRRDDRKVMAKSG
jgi:hypothetical protein